MQKQSENKDWIYEVFTEQEEDMYPPYVRIYPEQFEQWRSQFILSQEVIANGAAAVEWVVSDKLDFLWDEDGEPFDSYLNWNSIVWLVIGGDAIDVHFCHKYGGDCYVSVDVPEDWLA